MTRMLKLQETYMGSIQEALSEGFRNMTGALTGPMSGTVNSASPVSGNETLEERG